MGTLHHLKVGCADASVIITETATFLIDCHKIEEHTHLLPASKRLRGVFITHQHKDHYSGLSYLKSEGYSIDCLIYSPYQRRYGDDSVTIEEWDEFNGLKDHFGQHGSDLYPVYRQEAWDKPWWATNGVKFWMIGPNKAIAQSETREIHDASLVVKANMLDKDLETSRKCCFAGDASDTSLEWIAANTNHYCDDILHASHHGSLNGAQLDFVKGCSARYTVVSTESGVYENVPHAIALQRYRDHTAKEVYRTDVDGSLKWSF